MAFYFQQAIATTAPTPVFVVDNPSPEPTPEQVTLSEVVEVDDELARLIREINSPSLPVAPYDVTGAYSVSLRKQEDKGRLFAGAALLLVGVSILLFGK